MGVAMNTEQEILNAFERGKAFGFAEGMKSMRLKEYTDDKIADLIKATNDEIGMINIRTFDFVKVLLRKVGEK
jgi:hypothetical protein